MRTNQNRRNYNNFELSGYLMFFSHCYFITAPKSRLIFLVLEISLWLNIVCALLYRAQLPGDTCCTSAAEAQTRSSLKDSPHFSAYNYCVWLANPPRRRPLVTFLICQSRNPRVDASNSTDCKTRVFTQPVAP